jgi:phosphoribosylanthranilate isomerase
VTLVKICGVTRAADAAAVATSGADYLGLNFWPGSRRHVGMAEARDLAAAARTAGARDVQVRLVGLFVDAPTSDIEAIALSVGLDAIQLHGDEAPDDCQVVFQRTGLPVWKAVAVTSPASVADLARWPVAAIVLDAATPGRGGSGQTIDWTVAAAAVRGPRPIVLAGGLAPGNVAAAIDAVRPWAVDVASGVETAPGVKDPDRIAAFVREVRSP